MFPPQTKSPLFGAFYFVLLRQFDGEKGTKVVKKIIISLLVGVMLLAPVASLEAYDQPASQTYLVSHNNNPWTVMALAALGVPAIPADFLKSLPATTAIEYTAPILAITSLGQDPRTFGSKDYVAALESFHSNGQLGDPATLNDDIFGVLALVSAGVAASDPVVSDSKNFLLTHQSADGGWGFTVNSSDTNMTAAAILALLASGVAGADSHIQAAVDYLKSAQNEDGGFPYDPKSSFGTASDTSSTAWVTWALQALQIPATSWSKAGHSPVDFLNSTQTAAGYFEFQKGSGEDSFSPVTTAYAVIALAGKSLPLRIITPSASRQFDFRIEGSTEQICAGQAAGPTALDIVKNATAICGFGYHISNTSFGPYLDQIGSDKAAGLTGWLYLVDFNAPSVGAADYVLKPGDSVLWFYGDFNWKPARLSASETAVASGASIALTVEQFSENIWSPLPDATVNFGAQTATTNAAGQVSITPGDGFYKVFASESGFVRSSAILLKVGQPRQAGVNLNVVIGGSVAGATTTPPLVGSVSFTVEPGTLDFGTLAPGTSAQKSVTVTNTGSGAIHIESIVTGDVIFQDNLKVGAVPWQNFLMNLAQGANQNEPVELSVPVGYPAPGAKSGELTFWAMAQ